MTWIEVCPLDDIEREDMLRFDHRGCTYVIYRTAEDGVYCTSGLCTHGRAHLSEGFLSGHVVECPKHNGRFDIRTGQPKGPPVSVALTTFPARVEDGRIWSDLPT